MQILLDGDIETGKHLRMKPKELHETRYEYKFSKPTNLRFHIEQSIRTAKYNRNLKLKSDYKLKITMVKYDMGDVDVDEL